MIWVFQFEKEILGYIFILINAFPFIIVFSQISSERVLGESSLATSYLQKFNCSLSPGQEILKQSLKIFYYLIPVFPVSFTSHCYILQTIYSCQILMCACSELFWYSALFMLFSFIFPNLHQSYSQFPL